MAAKDYDIVLIPSRPTEDRVIGLSQDLAKHDTYFTLKDGSFYPHLSLYMLTINDDQLSTVSQTLERIATSQEAIHLYSNRYRQHHGFIGVGYEKTTDIEKLQETIITAVTPYRSGEDTYDLVGELFEPHVTITRFKDHNEFETSELPLPDSFETDFYSLALFELGKHGTCIRKVVEYPLNRV